MSNHGEELVISGWRSSGYHISNQLTLQHRKCINKFWIITFNPFIYELSINWQSMKYFFTVSKEKTNNHSQSRVSYNGNMKHEHVKTRLDDKMTIQGTYFFNVDQISKIIAIKTYSNLRPYENFFEFLLL